MTSQPGRPNATTTELDDCIRRCQDALRHQVQGDSEPFLEVWSHADDVAILGAIGSYASGWDNVRTHLLAAAQGLNWTSVSVENIVTFVADDLAITVALERMTRDAGEPDTRTLRVTHAYRRGEGEWRLILRHANPVAPQDEERERGILGHA